MLLNLVKELFLPQLSSIGFFRTDRFIRKFSLIVTWYQVCIISESCEIENDLTIRFNVR